MGGKADERWRYQVKVAALRTTLRRVARLPRSIVIVGLKAYKLGVSPLLPAACRYHPTCSEYCREAVERHGALKGLWLGLRRVCRCHPLRKGGMDPVP